MLRESGLGAVPPSNGLWGPVLVVIVDIGPFILTRSVVFVEATSHVNAVLFEFLVGKLLRLGGPVLIPDYIWIGCRSWLYTVGGRGESGQRVTSAATGFGNKSWS